jgi:aspartokinase
MKTTAEITKEYIDTHPSIKDCIRNNLINYSKLAEKIAAEMHIEKKTSKDAIIEQLKPDKVHETQVMSILKNSELEIKNKIVVVIIRKTVPPKILLQIEEMIKKEQDIFYSIEGSTAITVITTLKYKDPLTRMLGAEIIKMSADLAMITIKSPQELETTPGVIAYLYSLFGEHGINISETMSCWTNTIFIINENDISKAISFLKF